jgi:hypothetical protein
LESQEHLIQQQKEDIEEKGKEILNLRQKLDETRKELTKETEEISNQKKQEQRYQEEINEKNNEILNLKNQMASEKKEFGRENGRLLKENKVVHGAVSKLFERLSAVSVGWRPDFARKQPTKDNLSDEGQFGAVGSVTTLSERNPSLLKKKNKEIPFLFLDFLHFGAHAKKTKLTSSTFFSRKDETQKATEKVIKGHRSTSVQTKERLR